MQKYELVLVLDHAMKAEDRKSAIDDIESKIKKSLLEKDDIGLLDLAYPLHGISDKTRAYFVSYYLELDQDGLELIQKTLLYNKAVLKNMLFHMTFVQPFFKFIELQKKLEKIIEGWGKQKFGQKLNFFSKDASMQYLTRKAVPMLKKYVTRFADIKPRSYTGNSVSRQKKLRKCIIRWRELGLLEYVK